MSKEIQFPDASGNTDYAILINEVGAYYNTVNTVFEAFSGAQFTNYDLPATEDGTSGWYTADFPSPLTQGIYRIQARKRVGGSPAQSDPIVAAGDIFWNGGNQYPMPSQLTKETTHGGPNTRLVLNDDTDAGAPLSVTTTGVSSRNAAEFLSLTGISIDGINGIVGVTTVQSVVSNVNAVLAAGVTHGGTDTRLVLDDTAGVGSPLVISTSASNPTVLISGVGTGVTIAAAQGVFISTSVSQGISMQTATDGIKIVANGKGMDIQSAGAAGISVLSSFSGTDAIILQGDGSGAGLRAIGGGTGAGVAIAGGATGKGMTIAAGGGNNTALSITGTGTQPGTIITGGSTGAGMVVQGGGGNGNAITFLGAGAGSGIQMSGGGTNGNALVAQGGGNASAIAITGSGTGSGMTISAGASGNHALIVTGAGTGAGIRASGGSGTGAGIDVLGGSTNGTGINIAGVGLGRGVLITGGASGEGMQVIGNGGLGGFVAASAASGLPGMYLLGGTNGDGLRAEGVGVGHGINAQGGNSGGSGVNMNKGVGSGNDLRLVNFDISTPFEAPGRPTSLLAMIRRVFEWTTNKKTRDTSTGNKKVFSAITPTDVLETQVQSTVGTLDQETQGA